MGRTLSLALSALLMAQPALATSDVFCMDPTNVVSYEDTGVDDEGTWVRVVHFSEHNGWGWMTGVTCPGGDVANGVYYEPHPSTSLRRLEEYAVEKVRTGTVKSATANSLIGLRGSRQYLGNDPETDKPYGISCCELGKE